MTFQEINLLFDILTGGYALLLIFDKTHFKANWFIIAMLSINALLGLLVAIFPV